MFPWHREKQSAPSNPFRDERESRRDRTSLANAGPLNDYGLDQETWAFVQSELRDAPAEERTALLEALDTLDSTSDRQSMIRMLLRTRRLSINGAKQRREKSTQLAGHSNHDAWDERQRFEAGGSQSWPPPDQRSRDTPPGGLPTGTPHPSAIGRTSATGRTSASTALSKASDSRPLGRPNQVVDPRFPRQPASAESPTGRPSIRATIDDGLNDSHVDNGLADVQRIAQQQMQRLDVLRNRAGSGHQQPNPQLAGFPSNVTPNNHNLGPIAANPSADPRQLAAITQIGVNPLTNRATNSGYTVPNTPLQISPNGNQPQPAPTGTVGLPSANAEAWRQELGQLISVLESATAQPVANVATMSEQERQRLISQHLYLRMLYVMSGQGTRALATSQVPFKDDKEREFWRQLFWAFNQYFDADTLPNKSDRITQTLNQLRFAVQELQPRAHLELRNVNFCNSISSFGNYESFPRNEFPVGEEVLIYAEVVNFTSEIAGERFHSRLQPSIEIYQAGNDSAPVKTMKYEATPDYCSNPRQDFYLSIMYTIPKGLAQGPHTLKLMVTDVLGNKVATYPLRFTVR